MKLQPDKSSAPLVRAYTETWLQIDDQRFEQSVIVSSLPGAVARAWRPCSFASMQAHDLETLADSDAELVILGTGRRQMFPPVPWLAPFLQKRLGLEAMDTAAACRTYNILAGEGRRVVAALLIENA